MNILWMTLLACIGLTFLSVTQFSEMKQDLWWQKLSSFYRQEREKEFNECQKQIYRGLSRDLSDAPELRKKLAQGEGISRTESKQESYHAKAFEIEVYPMNARLPLFKEGYLSSKNADKWQAAFWLLLDQLYGKEPFFIQWRDSIDKKEFILELFKGIEEIKKNFNYVDTYGLSILTFQDKKSQEVWQALMHGSDRLGVRFPSLAGYLWPSDIARGQFNQKLSLPYASSKVMTALLGEEFTRKWQQEVTSAIIEDLRHRDLVDNPQNWVLTRSAYQKIFGDVCRSLGIDEQLAISFVELNPSRRGKVSEILIRSSGSFDRIVSTKAAERNREK